MKKPFDIVVSGAGAIGLAMTALFARMAERHPVRVTLVDVKAPGPVAAGDDIGLRVSALSAGSLELLARLGVAEALRHRAGRFAAMRVWDAGHAPDGPGTLEFSAADMALPELGCIVEDAVLRHALFARLADSDVTLAFGAAVESVVAGDDGMRLGLAGGAELKADLVIGADGGRSAVREALGIETDGWRYPQAALVTHARPERSHGDTAWQRFLDSGPIALLPLADGRVSIVWSTSAVEAAELAQLPDAELSARLTAASDAVLGRLEVAGPRGSFPLAARHARHYVRRGAALIGDAAHTVHPLAGQGANLGLADARELANVVEDALAAGEHPADLPVLRRYERARRGVNATMLWFVDGLNRLFAAPGELSAAIRAGGLTLFNRSGPLKRRAMGVALGLSSAGGERRGGTR